MVHAPICIDTQLRRQTIDERRREGHVIDSCKARSAAAGAGVPSALDAVGVGGDEVERLGDLIETHAALSLVAAAASAVEEEHEGQAGVGVVRAGDVGREGPVEAVRGDDEARAGRTKGEGGGLATAALSQCRRQGGEKEEREEGPAGHAIAAH